MLAGREWSQWGTILAFHLRLGAEGLHLSCSLESSKNHRTYSMWRDAIPKRFDLWDLGLGWQDLHGNVDSSNAWCFSNEGAPFEQADARLHL
jgi:hypothetical protein